MEKESILKLNPRKIISFITFESIGDPRQESKNDTSIGLL